MENREISLIPGSVSTKPLPLTGLLQHESSAQERPKSSDILEELLTQGIIPVGQTRERGSGAGEAYNIMLDDQEGAKRRPPARLESLKAKTEQSPTSREAIDEKMRQAEERRKLREDELNTRLRTKSARVRVPAPTSTTPQEEDPTVTVVELLHAPLIPQLTPDLTGTPGNHEDLRDLPLHTQVREATHTAAEGGEAVREAGGDGWEGRGGGGDKADNRGEALGSKQQPLNGATGCYCQNIRAFRLVSVLHTDRDNKGTQPERLPIVALGDT
ncbi:uncharacterized protein stmnd1 [Genypterus blacodes]|uniref:uncharacterized protein stmnd1 n=1 Tax=Genypterus blacodes TaxID=154954 RepID=UPI003F766EE9